MSEITASCCNQQNELAVDFDEIEHNERRTLWVVILTFSMMIFEVAAGYWTGSMALLADGYHMASHAGALGIAFLVYKLAKSETLKRRLSFGSGKLLPLGGYTSAIGLGIIALWMGVESIYRFLHPTNIQFNEAIAVAVLGLAVNVLSAFILGTGHHHHHNDEHDDHDHRHVEDHNHRSALVHVIADALTSVLAIVALFAGKFYAANWLDPMMGIVGAVVILRWAYVLCRETTWELLDGHPKSFAVHKIRDSIERSGNRVIDLHIWKVGPANHVCQLVVESKEKKGSDYFRQFIPNAIGPVHLVVEER